MSAFLQLSAPDPRTNIIMQIKLSVKFDSETQKAVAADVDDWI